MAWARRMRCLLFVCLAAIAASSIRAQTYTLTDLGTLGGPAAFPAWLSQSYLVGGSLSTEQDEYAFTWITGQALTPLSDLSNLADCAFAVNNSGNATGLYLLGDNATEHAMAWINGKKLDLGTLKGGSVSQANANNNHNEVVGTSTVTVNAYTGFSYEGFLWRAGIGMKAVKPFYGNLYTSLNAINDDGVAVGSADTVVGTGVHAIAGEHAIMVGVNSTVHDLGTLGGRNSTAWAINATGQVVGSSDTPAGDQHAFLWTSTTGMIDLGVPPGWDASIAYSINASGQVTGETYNLATQTFGGFVWVAVNGMRDIDTLIPSGGPSLFGVVNNDLGWLAAAGVDSTGEQHVYLLQP